MIRLIMHFCVLHFPFQQIVWLVFKLIWCIFVGKKNFFQKKTEYFQKKMKYFSSRKNIFPADRIFFHRERLSRKNHVKKDRSARSRQKTLTKFSKVMSTWEKLKCLKIGVYFVCNQIKWIFRCARCTECHWY